MGSQSEDHEVRRDSPTDRSKLKAAAEAMNWRRGLFRLWLMLVVLLWAPLAAYATYEEYTRWPAQFAQHWPETTVALIVGPPLALFLLGYALLWIGRGFRPKT